MSELTPHEVQARFAALVGDLEIQSSDASTGCGHPAILLSRLTHDSEDLAGRRARLRIPKFNEHQGPATHGWRTDLRILSDTPTLAGGAGQAVVSVIDEAGFYSEDHSGAAIIDCSRLWVEELVRVPPDSVDLGTPGAWLRGPLEDPNEPMVEPLHPVARRPHLIGSRLARDLGGGRFQPDLRAVSAAQVTSDGDVVVAVADEGRWYGWRRLDQPPATRCVATDGLWVE